MNRELSFNEKQAAFVDAFDKAVEYLNNEGMQVIADTLAKYAPIMVRKPMRGKSLSLKSKRQLFADMLIAGPVSVDDVYKLFGWGRKEAMDAIRGRRNSASRAHRFDEIQWVKIQEGFYVLVGTGKEPPKGWDDDH